MAMVKDIATFAVFPDRTAFDTAIDALRMAGFRPTDISAVLPDRDVTNKDLAHEVHTKAPEGIATGAGAGAAVGGVLGWLVGIGAIAIPGVGPLLAAGPIVAALAGAGAAGAAGGLVGGLVGAGMPEIEAKRYAGRLRDGGYLLSVHCDDREWAAKAREVLTTAGGQDVVSTSESRADYRP
jgi:hypothetical protein